MPESESLSHWENLGPAPRSKPSENSTWLIHLTIGEENSVQF